MVKRIYRNDWKYQNYLQMCIVPCSWKFKIPTMFREALPCMFHSLMLPMWVVIAHSLHLSWHPYLHHCLWSMIMHMLSHVEFDMCIWINSLDDTGIFWINSLDDTGINIYPISATAKPDIPQMPQELICPWHCQSHITNWLKNSYNRSWSLTMA